MPTSRPSRIRCEAPAMSPRARLEAVRTNPSAAQANPPRVTLIRPSGGLFDVDLAAVWRYRELLFFLVWREVKIRYKQAALGVAWAVVQPLFTVLIFTTIFGIFARFPSDGLPYPVFALAAVLPWTYFA